MSQKRNIDAVLGAVGQGHGEAENRHQAQKAIATRAPKKETTVATFTFTLEFLAQVRRLGLDWRDKAVPASRAREGAVIQALAQAALANPKCLEQAFQLAKNKNT